MFNIFKIEYIIILHTILTGIESAKILGFYPGASISHQIVFRSLTSELIKRGHQVTVVTTNPMYLNGSLPGNLTEIDIGEVSYKTLKDYCATTITGKQSDIISQVEAGLNVNIKIFEQIVKLQKISNLIKYHREKFDLLLLEAFISPLLGLTHIFKIPTILISSFGPFPGNYEVIGAPTHPTIYSEFLRQRIYNLTLWEKLREVLNHFRIRSAIGNLEAKTNKLLPNIFGSDIPLLEDLKNNVDMLFLNVHPIWEENHPVPPKVIFMGGLHQTLAKKLPQNLQYYLDNSDQGVIYFSFGTNFNTSLLSENTIALFKNVFSKLPYNVLWKWDSDKFPVKLKNIKLFNWLPQADLLRHKNVKVFITQGGLQSTDEAITAGVPLIGIPMMGDQWHNVEKYVYHKIGIRLDFEYLTEEKLRHAIIEVAEKKRYRNNIIRLRTLMQDQPQTPLERTIWWIEYVLRHSGSKHLRAPAANMSWYNFLVVELVGPFIFATFTLIIFVYLITKLLIIYVLKIFLIKIKLKKT